MLVVMLAVCVESAVVERDTSFAIAVAFAASAACALVSSAAVSYTHLTLPTKRIV